MLKVFEEETIADNINHGDGLVILGNNMSFIFFLLFPYFKENQADTFFALHDKRVGFESSTENQGLSALTQRAMACEKVPNNKQSNSGTKFSFLSIHALL